jgi:Flp pilus assembly protein TadD
MEGQIPGVECPTCGAADQSGPACRRCRSDLRLLQRLEAQRSAELHELARALANGRWSEALLSAQYIHTLRKDDTSFRMLAVCQLLNSQFQAARDTHRQYRTPSGR